VTARRSRSGRVLYDPRSGRDRREGAERERDRQDADRQVNEEEPTPGRILKDHYTPPAGIVTDWLTAPSSVLTIWIENAQAPSVTSPAFRGEFLTLCAGIC